MTLLTVLTDPFVAPAALLTAVVSFPQRNSAFVSAQAAAQVVYHAWAYFADPYGYRQHGIKGPWLAQFSDFWLSRQAARGKRSEAVHEQHLKYGTSPRPLSLAVRPEASTF